MPVTDEELALIAETRERLGFYVTPEDPEWPIPPAPPVEGARFWDETGVSVYRNGKWIPASQDGLSFAVGRSDAAPVECTEPGAVQTHPFRPSTVIGEDRCAACWYPREQHPERPEE